MARTAAPEKSVPKRSKAKGRFSLFSGGYGSDIIINSIYREIKRVSSTYIQGSYIWSGLCVYVHRALSPAALVIFPRKFRVLKANSPHQRFSVWGAAQRFRHGQVPNRSDSAPDAGPGVEARRLPPRVRGLRTSSHLTASTLEGWSEAVVPDRRTPPPPPLHNPGGRYEAEVYPLLGERR